MAGVPRRPKCGHRQSAREVLQITAYAAQARLQRVLEEGEVDRIGAEDDKAINMEAGGVSEVKTDGLDDCRGLGAGRAVVVVVVENHLSSTSRELHWSYDTAAVQARVKHIRLERVKMEEQTACCTREEVAAHRVQAATYQCL